MTPFAASLPRRGRGSSDVTPLAIRRPPAAFDSKLPGSGSAGHEQMERFGGRRANSVERLDQDVGAAGRGNSDPPGRRLLECGAVLNRCKRGRVHATADIVGEL